MSDSYLEIGEVAHQRDPREFPWGYFSYGDAPGGIGGGTGLILWFASHREMLDFFLHHELESHWLENADEDERAEVLREVRTALEPLSESKSGLQSALAAANEPLRNLVQLTWWGRFEELVSGSGEFAMHLRSFFRSDDSDEEGRSSPITDAELSDFVESLQEYGL